MSYNNGKKTLCYRWKFIQMIYVHSFWQSAFCESATFRPRTAIFLVSCWFTFFVSQISFLFWLSVKAYYLDTKKMTQGFTMWFLFVEIFFVWVDKIAFDIDVVNMRLLDIIRQGCFVWYTLETRVRLSLQHVTKSNYIDCLSLLNSWKKIRQVNSV